MSDAQPSDELLEKIQQIASMKRELPREMRAVTSGGGLYVWADELPDGRMLVRAGSRSIFAKLIFYVHPDGRTEVKKYRPGDWETKADTTLYATRALFRAATWTLPPSKQDAFFADETTAQDDPKWQEARDAWHGVATEHKAEIKGFYDTMDEKVGMGLMDIFFGTLIDEWPVALVETLADPKRAPDILDIAAKLLAASYGAGYVIRRGWLPRQHLDYMVIDAADHMVRAVREINRLPGARRYPYIEAFWKVAELGIAASEKGGDVSAEGNDKPAETAPEQGVSRGEAQGRWRLLEERWKAQLKEKKRRSPRG